MYKKIIIISICSLITFISSEKVFPLDLVESKFYPEGDVSNVYPVKLSYFRKTYQDSWEFSEVKSGEYEVDSEELFIVKVIDLNRSGTQEDVLNLFDPDSRVDLVDKISDLNLFNRSQNYFKNIDKSYFLMKIKYGGFSIYFIQNSGDLIGDVVNVYVVKTIENIPYLTNELKDDFVYLYFINKLKEQISLK